jgi:hypothetical protein
VNIDPDGLNFFTDGTAPVVPAPGGVFVSMPEDYLERMLGLEGAEEIGARSLPDSASGEWSDVTTPHAVAVPDHPLTLHPSLLTGTPQWRRDFVLNGPDCGRASTPAPLLPLTQGGEHVS